MPAWLIRIAQLDQLAPGGSIAVEVDGNDVALFRVGGETLAIDDACARCGSSLAGGAVRGATVACVGCGWEYDLRTGAVSDVPALRLDTHEVTVVDSDVMIAVERAWPSDD